MSEALPRQESQEAGTQQEQRPWVRERSDSLTSEDWVVRTSGLTKMWCPL